jgi:hypothetical protein
VARCTAPSKPAKTISRPALSGTISATLTWFVAATMFAPEASRKPPRYSGTCRGDSHPGRRLASGRSTHSATPRSLSRCDAFCTLPRTTISCRPSPSMSATAGALLVKCAWFAVFSSSAYPCRASA